MLWSLGSNGSGQLGLGHEEDAHAPALVTLPDDAQDVAHITAGGNHTLLHLRDGRVLASGENGNGRHGEILGKRTMFGPALPVNHSKDGNVKPNEHWKLCSATWEASTFVTHESYVLCCGTGNKGELGLGQDVTSTSGLTPLPDFPPPGLAVDDLAASMGHTVAVLSDGSVWGWGNGRKGQLGQPATVCWVPRKIEGIPFKVTKAVCGRDFVFVAGPPDTGDCLILGSDKFDLQSGMPQRVLRWKQIVAAWGSVFVLLQDGQLLAWGRNDRGQLGPSNLPPLEMIAAGSEHVLALTNAGEVLAWGWGEHGNCGSPMEGDGVVKDRYNVLPIARRCLYLAAGCATSWIHCEE